jgi:hypothetical protein
MRRLVFGLVALASSVTFGAMASQAGGSITVGTSASVVIQPCAGKPEVRPATFTISCGDGNSYLTKLKWTSWTSTSAKATGTYTVNNCDPYCAAGKFISSQAAVTLSKPKNAKSYRFFTNLHVAYVSGPKFKTFNFALLT